MSSMKQKLLLFLPFLIASALVFAAYSYAPSKFVVMGSRVTLVGLTSSSTNIVRGSPIDFSVTMSNDGTLSTVANTNITIYASNGSAVDYLIFDPVVIAPSQTVTMTKTWNSGNNLPGLYRAVAIAEYDGNLTNSLNITFTIYIPVVQPSGGPSQVSMGPIVLPSVIQPTQPLQGQFGFIKTAVLDEILAGQGAVESILLKNTGGTNLTTTLSISGVPADWIVGQPNETILMPGETRVVNLQINVPDDAPSGNYLVRLNAMAGGTSTEDFLALRVKNYPGNYEEPIATKTITIDQENQQTTVSIDIKNPSQNTMKYVALEEEIPLAFDGESIQFLDKPGTISEVDGSRFVTWEFEDLAPQEEVHFSYTISGILTDYSTYDNWYIYQITTTEKIQLADLVKIEDLTTTVAPDGASANVTASVLYAGVSPINVTMLLEAPEGFGVKPTTITTTLIPAAMEYAEFSLTIPQTSEETHLLQFVVLGDNFSVYSTTPIVVTKPATTPSFSILSVLSLEQVVAVSSFIAAVVVVSALSYRRIRTGSKSEYSQERLDYMKSIKKMVTGKHNK